jgi:hypothetical protein
MKLISAKLNVKQLDVITRGKKEGLVGSRQTILAI